MRNSGFELQFFQSSNRLRAKTEVMEEISSQNSDLGLEDLDKLEAKGQAEFGIWHCLLIMIMT